MENSDAERNQADAVQQRAAQDGNVISVLYVEPDPETRDRVMAHLTAEDGLATQPAAEATEARQLLESSSVDCLVTESSVLSGPDDVLLAGSPTTIMYTEEDPWKIPDATLEAVDSLVEKDVDGSRHFLAQKIRGVVQTHSLATSQWGNVLDKLGEDIDDVGLFLVDDQGVVRWSNTSFEEFFPATNATQAHDTSDLYTRLGALFSNDPETLRDVLRPRRTDQQRHGHVVELTGEENTERYLHASYPVDDGPAGDRIELFVSVSTVSDRYERLGMFEELVDNAEDGLYVLDADGRVVYLNQSFADMLGYDRETLLGSHASKTMAQVQLQKGQNVVQRLSESEHESEVVDLQFTREDGETVDTSVHFSVRTDDDEYAGVMGVVRDITERKQRERELEEYRNLVESAGDPMYVLDEDGNIQVLNAALAEFVGEHKGTLVGKNVKEVLPAKSLEQGRNALKRLLDDDTQTDASFETWLTDADGEDRLFEVTVSTITEDSEFVGSVATFRDITKRHRRQEELDLRKQIFARSLRHNIRNETSIIRSYGSILAEELDGDHAEMAEDVLAASRSLARTSEKVSQFDWLVEQDPELVVHDLPQLVPRCLEEVRDVNPDASVRVDLPESVRVRAIRDLDVAIRNLVENALQHGTGTNPPTVTIDATVEEEHVSFVVADDGPGIPEAEISVIEQGRETALDHASGLGLWLVRRVIDQSDGDLAFETGDGTRVTITLERVRQ